MNGIIRWTALKGPLEVKYEQCFSRIPFRIDIMCRDIHIEHITNLEVRLDVLHLRLGVVAQEGVHAHYYTRRAEATLRPVWLGDPLLHCVQFSSGNQNICQLKIWNFKWHIRIFP